MEGKGKETKQEIQNNKIIDMKFKALRKKDTKEFIELHTINDEVRVFISETPKLHPMTATLESIKSYYGGKREVCEIDWDNIELMTFNLYEENTVGADIRNKLSPPLNLISLIDLYLKSKTESTLGDAKFIPYIKREMLQTKKSIDYLSELL